MTIKKIEQVLIDQKSDLRAILGKGKIIQREVFIKYSKIMKSPLIKIITGPRRAGKSVLSFQLIRNKKFGYVNFDDERLFPLEPADLNSILEALYSINEKPKFLFFDEIQNAPGWELFVNRLARQGFNIIVTGSNAKLLGTEMSTHLTGRHLVLNLYPFSFREYLDFNDCAYQSKIFSTKERALLNRHSAKYLAKGGFPEVVQGENHKQYIVSLYSSILTRDIILRHKIKHVDTLKELSNYLIDNFSRKITFNKIKNIFSLKSVHTVKNYVSFLKEAYLVFDIEKFSFKPKERVVAPRKIYAIDLGLVNVLSSKFSRDSGHIYENAVALELLRKQSFEDRVQVYYWEDLYNREVDFVVKRGSKIKELIQASYNIQNYDTKKREVTSLLKASKELRCNNLLVITQDFEGEEKIKGKRIKFIPLWKWLLK